MESGDSRCIHTHIDTGEKQCTCYKCGVALERGDNRLRPTQTRTDTNNKSCTCNICETTSEINDALVLYICTFCTYVHSNTDEKTSRVKLVE